MSLTSLSHWIKARYRIDRTIGLWHHPAYSPGAMRAAAETIGLGADRIENILSALERRKLLKATDVRPPALADFEDIKLCHTAEYLESSLLASTLSQVFGVEVSEGSVDEILAWQRRAVSGTIEAATNAAKNLIQVGVNLGGGFHHAHANRGGGYCLYNDVAIAIRKLRKSGYSGRIVVLDLDFHQGDGTAAILREEPGVLCVSLQGGTWIDIAGPAIIEETLSPGAQDDAYQAALERKIFPRIRAFKPELIFFIAGNDVLEGDRIGTFSLSPLGVLNRDVAVVTFARELDAGLVVTLGGGYSPLAWQCTTNLIRFLLTDVKEARTDWATDLRKHFTQIAATLDPKALSGGEGDGYGLSESELLMDMNRVSRPRKVADFYSPQGIELALEQYGILGKIREQGFHHLRVVVDPSDPEKQSIRVLSNDSELLLELVVSRPTTLGDFRMLVVKWLKIQNPRAKFRTERPRLPGQEHPGMGIADDVEELLVQACLRLNLDGILSNPAHYHNAAVASRWFHFFDPLEEGRFLAIKQTLHSETLANASKIVDEKRLRLRDGSFVVWSPGDQVLPVSDRMKAYFISDEYRAKVQSECRKLLENGPRVEQ